MDLSGADLDAVTRTILSEVGANATPASMAAIASVISQSRHGRRVWRLSDCRCSRAAPIYAMVRSERGELSGKVCGGFGCLQAGLGARAGRFPTAPCRIKLAARRTTTRRLHKRSTTRTIRLTTNNAVDPEHNPLVPSFAHGTPAPRLAAINFMRPLAP
jgi:hypothetical protein